MKNNKRTTDQTPEAIRIRQLYRRLIMKKEITLDLNTAKKMIGPDCAYHLYSKSNIFKIKK